MATSLGNKTAPHSCGVCLVACHSVNQLERHRNIHGKLRERTRDRRIIHACVHCRRRFATNERLQQHINEYHFKETEERYACLRCLRCKLPCSGTAPCKWCRIDGRGAQCEIVVPQNAQLGNDTAELAHYTAAPVNDAATSSLERRAQIRSAWSQDDMSAQQEEPSSTSGHAALGWSTPRPNSPTDRILKLPPRPLPPMDVDIKAGGLSPRISDPGEVNIRAGSLSWLDFEVAYLETHMAYIQRLIRGDSYPSPPGEPADEVPLYASQLQAVALDSLEILFKTSSIPRVVRLPELALVPGIELLKQLIDNYFSKWQTVQPIFHVATWEFAKCPMATLGAMACIGAVFDKDIEIVSQAPHISARCISVLNIMSFDLLENRSNIMYLAALCLYQTYVLSSGAENIHGEANRARKFLVDSLQSLGLLGGVHLSQGGPSPQVIGAPMESVQAEWTAWITREFEIRTTWAVFELDCSISLLTNSPCAIDLKDLPSRFPCSDEIYEVSNASTWNERRCQSPHHAQGPLVSTVVATTASRKVISDHISPWSKRLCTLILERICRGYVRQAKRDSTIAAAQHHDLDLGSVATERRESMIWSISFLGKSIPIPPSAMDFNFSSTMLIRHYTHLAVYSDVLDLIIFIAREAASNRSSNCRTTLRWAQQKLIEQFAARPYKSRQYIWHAGQMIQMAKVYGNFAPSDTLRIFTAYLAILAFAKYGPRSVRDVDGVEPFPIDKWHSDEKGTESWLQDGGPAQIGHRTVIQAGCQTDKIIEEAFHVLYNLENWAMWERFFITLVHFNELNVLV